MAPTGFTVTTERLDEASQFIKDKTSQYNTDITKLYSELDAMTSNEWRGVASETFKARIDSYHDEFNNLKTILDQFADNLKVKSQNYVSTENNVASAAQSI